jgi:hypothetical protein
VNYENNTCFPAQKNKANFRFQSIPKGIERKSEFQPFDKLMYSEFCNLYSASRQKEKKCSKDLPNKRIKKKLCGYAYLIFSLF